MRHYLVTLANGNTLKHKNDLSLSTNLVKRALKSKGYLVEEVLLIDKGAFERFNSSELA